MSKPRNCRHCSFMVCGDANWCDEHGETMSDGEIRVSRRCNDWTWNPIDALTLEEWHERPHKAVSDEQTRLVV